jgi:glutamate/tyrosine decarboxylase-like PLP-dependent enzyme
MERSKKIFETSYKMQEAVKRHPELRLMGIPTFCFSFTSDEFDIYHVNDYMKERGWRFNGQQFPSAIHMCVTGPQTQPGVVERFDKDLGEAVPYAKKPPEPVPISGALYGGQGTRTMAENVDLNMIREMLIAYQDACLEQPRS